MATERLEDQVEELQMMQRVDKELSSTLNLENVMMLTMDWALRRTGAATGMLCSLEPVQNGLIPLVMLGYPPADIPYNKDLPIPVTLEPFAHAINTHEMQFIPNINKEKNSVPFFRNAYSAIIMPIEMHGNILGVINLESDEPDIFQESDLSFIKRLAARSAIALDNARLYKQAQERADEMAALYGASRQISSSLDRQDTMRNGAQAIAGVLNVSSVVILAYQPKKQTLVASASYRLGTARTAPEILLAADYSIPLGLILEFSNAVNLRQKSVFYLSHGNISKALNDFMQEHHYRSLMLLPLATSEQVLGLALVIEGRRDKLFSPDDEMLADALGSQIAAAIRQAQLYEDVRELESLKSEMIRMASHDLKNPLNNAMNYLELFRDSLDNTLLTSFQRDCISLTDRSLTLIHSLIEDLLTLDRIESERETSWMEFNFSQLVQDVLIILEDGTLLKGQKLTISTTGKKNDIILFGSSTQLRQAISNLVNNAIKYTPDGGHIQVRLDHGEDRLRFEVEDNGYGIAKEKQSKLFQRFFRAREPGTDHIAGTGLGLSLVLTVVERHGGEVSVNSEPKVGSTFGFWLPLNKAKP